MYEYDILAYLITVGAIASFGAIVVGLFLASYGIKKQKEREEAAEKKDSVPVNYPVVDAIAFEIDTWEGKASVALMVDAVWKSVVDIDFKKLHKQYNGQTPRFIRSTIPIKAVRDMKSPRVFGGYV